MSWPTSAGWTCGLTVLSSKSCEYLSTNVCEYPNAGSYEYSGFQAVSVLSVSIILTIFTGRILTRLTGQYGQPFRGTISNRHVDHDDHDAHDFSCILVARQVTSCRISDDKRGGEGEGWRARGPRPGFLGAWRERPVRGAGWKDSVLGCSRRRVCHNGGRRLRPGGIAHEESKRIWMRAWEAKASGPMR
jgi:hypothetical protein